MVNKTTEVELTPEQQEALKAKELAIKHNHAEITTQLDKHFNGSEKDKKTALGNVETAFGNLTKVTGK